MVSLIPSSYQLKMIGGLRPRELNLLCVVKLLLIVAIRTGQLGEMTMQALLDTAGGLRLFLHNDGFLSSEEVYHPFVNGGDLIGEADLSLTSLSRQANTRCLN
ncbi:hypothetical protein N7519_008328 [Penicillium mononematosum]|uniref:uncharacterized protein n=1 Tax=Penicillium mononematosum TaxID=268346 RepID=UPI00254660FA|nr:uncharacterized protein N7519_008328 [Penicillium mononematosum]KAJ6177867.1 hypothetical protein N7519_008328 [Penicillium mononematosum]